MEDFGFSFNLASPSLGSPIQFSPTTGFGNLNGMNSELTVFYPSLSGATLTAASTPTVTLSGVCVGNNDFVITNVVSSGSNPIGTIEYKYNSAGFTTYTNSFKIASGFTMQIRVSTTAAIGQPYSTGTLLLRDGGARIIGTIPYTAEWS